jgi:hypothetical protein
MVAATQHQAQHVGPACADGKGMQMREL